MAFSMEVGSYINAPGTVSKMESLHAAQKTASSKDYIVYFILSLKQPEKQITVSCALTCLLAFCLYVLFNMACCFTASEWRHKQLKEENDLIRMSI